MAYFLNPINCIADKTYNLNGVTVKEYLLTKHNPNNISLPSKMKAPVMGVTVHNTGDLKNIEDDGRNYTAATVNNNMNSVRIHFYVDDLCAWQNMPLDYQSWHAGQRGKADRNDSENGNTRTISIECIMDGSTGAQNLKAEDNAARIAAAILHKYGLTIDNLYTHNYWCNVRKGRKGTTDYLNTTNDGYKNCPIFIRPHWMNFKNKVESYLNALNKNNPIPAPVPIPVKPSAPIKPDKDFEPYVAKIISSLNVRKNPGLNNPVVMELQKGDAYTIVAEQNVKNKNGSISTWGRLKSGIGWINVGKQYVKRI